MFAVIEGSTVTNIILANSVEIAEEVTGHKCIPAGDAQIGWVFDEETNELSAPVVIESVVIEVSDIPEGEVVIKSFNPLPQEPVEEITPTEG